MKTSKKVLITGVAGFLGSHLADELLLQGYRVVGIDNLIGGYLENVPREVEFHEMDCNDFHSVQSIMEDFDIVYHAACTAYEGLSVFSPRLVSENTFGATVSILTAAINSRVGRFVQLSSMARYGAQDTHPFVETMLCKPQDPYGIAKYSAEQIIKELCVTHSLEYSIAVPHNIIGPRQKYDDPFRNVASIMINLMLQGRQPYIYGDGEQLRCFSFVQDVIQPLVKIGTLSSANSETINIGPDEGSVTINGLAETIGKLLDFKVDPIYVPGRPREVKFATCSAKKARDLLGYKTNFTLEEGLSAMIEGIRERGARNFDYHLPLEIDSPLVPRTWKDRLF